MGNTNVAVIIPTFGRGDRVFTTLEKVLSCDPSPEEIFVHIDQRDEALRDLIGQRFPSVSVLMSPGRIGPGGGRDRCLQRCKSPFAVSFDDDSYPIDSDYFARVIALFYHHPGVAVLAARVWARGESPPAINQSTRSVASFTGCGFAIRTVAYRQTFGFIDRPLAYGIEEVDLSLQLVALDWTIMESHELRVMHDTDLAHRETLTTAAAMVCNVGLLAYLRYPLTMFGWAALQIGNMTRFQIMKGQIIGALIGLIKTPLECWRYRRLRRPLPTEAVKRYLALRPQRKPLF